MQKLYPLNNFEFVIHERAMDIKSNIDHFFPMALATIKERDVVE
jgi:hypothetical protein